MAAQLIEGLSGCPLSIEGYDFGRNLLKKVRRQGELLEDSQLINLVEDTFQANSTRVGFQVLPCDGGATCRFVGYGSLFILNLSFLLGLNCASTQQIIEM